jgi:non-heme chloroperoxidase
VSTEGYRALCSAAEQIHRTTDFDPKTDVRRFKLNRPIRGDRVAREVEHPLSKIILRCCPATRHGGGTVGVGTVARFSSGVTIGILKTLLFTALAFTCAPGFAQAPRAPFKDPSSHNGRMVDVGNEVKLEVLDWGGHGRTIVLLAGLPHTAHVFDDFAPKLARSYRVVGITRRGFGNSSAPRTGYTSDELGDDVLAVIASLHLSRPVLIGHSFGGLELSSIASRHPEKIAGVVYLDANFGHNPEDAILWYAQQDWREHLEDLKAKIAILDKQPDHPDEVIRELLQKTWPTFQADLETLLSANRARPPYPPATDADRVSYATVRAWYARNNGVQIPEAEFRQILATEADGRPKISFRQPPYVSEAVRKGEQKYIKITAPALGVFAIWDKPWPSDPADARAPADAAAYARIQARYVANVVARFREMAPQGRALQVHLAQHYVFMSNEQEVLTAINEFTATLP